MLGSGVKEEGERLHRMESEGSSSYFERRKLRRDLSGRVEMKIVCACMSERVWSVRVCVCVYVCDYTCDPWALYT
jgi:hypothetical protein